VLRLKSAFKASTQGAVPANKTCEEDRRQPALAQSMTYCAIDFWPAGETLESAAGTPWPLNQFGILKRLRGTDLTPKTCDGV
jgi:hypothetical protein